MAVEIAEPRKAVWYNDVSAILKDGGTLPSVFYTDEEIARVEDDRLFRRSWQAVGIEAEIPNVGDFFTTEIAGTHFSVPVVVLRDENSQLRAHVNVCRHRAHAVAVDRGNRKALQCSYHGWVYGLDGCLKNVPRGGEGGLPPYEELGLYSISVDTFAGYIFVCIEPRADLMTELGEFPTVLRRLGHAFPFAPENIDPEHTYTRDPEVVFDLQGSCNWKTILENTLECYHCPTTHTNTLSKMIKVDGDNYENRQFDRGSYQWTNFQDVVATKLGMNLSRFLEEQDNAEERPHFEFYWLFPNMFFTGNGSVIRLMPNKSTGSFKSETLQYHMPGAVEQDPESKEQFAAWLRGTLEEDIAATTRVQAGLASGVYDYGFTLPHSEVDMRHFYRLVVDELFAETSVIEVNPYR